MKRPKRLERRRHGSRAPYPIAAVGLLIIAFSVVGIAAATLAPREGKLTVGASRCGERTALPIPHVTVTPKPPVSTTTVRQGESLSDIAQRTMGDKEEWRAIAWLNRIPPAKYTQLQIGQKLYIPRKE